jgi:hypothetical protein
MSEDMFEVPLSRLIEMTEEIARLNERVNELTEQANSAYAPYRAMVMDARAETNKFSAEVASLQTVLDATRERLTDAEEEIRKVDNWAKAYPVDVFPEPNPERCKRLLEAGGESIDCLAAYARRGAIEWIGYGTRAYFAKWKGAGNGPGTD